MKTINSSPAALVATSLASFRATVAAMEKALDVSILYGSGFAVIMKEPFRDTVIERVAARVDPKTRVYSVNAAICWPTLDILPDHLCGLCLYTPESADRIVADLMAKGDGNTYGKRHIREIQTDRLARAREMVATLEGIAAKLAEKENRDLDNPAQFSLGAEKDSLFPRELP
jgi:hypothetical protein